MSAIAAINAVFSKQPHNDIDVAQTCWFLRADAWAVRPGHIVPYIQSFIRHGVVSCLQVWMCGLVLHPINVSLACRPKAPAHTADSVIPEMCVVYIPLWGSSIGVSDIVTIVWFVMTRLVT